MATTCGLVVEVDKVLLLLILPETEILEDLQALLPSLRRVGAHADLQPARLQLHRGRILWVSVFPFS